MATSLPRENSCFDACTNPSNHLQHLDRMRGAPSGHTRVRRGLQRAALLLVALAAGTSAQAATCTAVGNGSWIVPATWSGCAGGVPGAADTARINAGSTVTIPTGETVTVAAIEFGATGFTLGLNVDGTLNVGDVTHPNGTINGPGAITVTGTYNWSGNGAIAGMLQGGIAPPLTFAPGSVWNLTGPAMPLRRRAVVQQGVATFSAGVLDCSSTVSWLIAAGGSLTVSHDGQITSLDVNCLIRNEGTIRKTGAGTTFRLTDTRVRLENHGLIEVLGGTFNFDAAGGPTEHSGIFRTSAGATLIAPRSEATFTAAAQFEGTGLVDFNGSGVRSFLGTKTFPGRVLLSSSTADLEALGGSELQFDGGLDWTGGRLLGPGVFRIPTGTTLLINPANVAIVGPRARLHIAGEARWLAGQISFQSTAASRTELLIAPGGSFDVLFRPATINFGNGDPLFDNAGTFTATANANTGPLAFSFGVGDSIVHRGTTRLAGAVTVQPRWRQTGGTLALQDTQLTAPATPLRALTLDGGRLEGTGTITGDLINNTGVLAPGSSAGPGRLAIVGRYTEAAGARLAFRVGGAGAGQYDELQLSGSFGTAALAGTLAVQRLGNYQFAPADSVPILIANARTGAFSAVELDPGFSPPPLVQELAGGVVLGLSTNLFSDGFEPQP